MTAWPFDHTGRTSADRFYGGVPVAERVNDLPQGFERFRDVSGSRRGDLDQIKDRPVIRDHAPGDLGSPDIQADRAPGRASFPGSPAGHLTAPAPTSDSAGSAWKHRRSAARATP